VTQKDGLELWQSSDMEGTSLDIRRLREATNDIGQYGGYHNEAAPRIS
jgi:hypothetical protein